MNLQPAEQFRDRFARIPLVDQMLELHDKLKEYGESTFDLLKQAAKVIEDYANPPVYIAKIDSILCHCCNTFHSGKDLMCDKCRNDEAMMKMGHSNT